VTGVSEKAAPRLKRSSRIGFGGGTAPFGMATTTVNAAPGAMSSCVNVAVVPLLSALAHVSLDSTGPLKHPTRVISAGAWTLTVARSIGTVHPGPIALRNSSSWSSKPLSTPRNVYVMSYVCSPLIVRSGSPILMRLRPMPSMSPLSSVYCAGVPSDACTDSTSSGYTRSWLALGS
jgi:hypothetical protein